MSDEIRSHRSEIDETEDQEVGLSLFDLLDDDSLRMHVEDAHVRSSLLQQLIQTRHLRDLTQSLVAEIMETTQSAVSEMEGGLTDPRLSTLQRYARAVGSQLTCSLASPNGLFQTMVIRMDQDQYSVHALQPFWSAGSSEQGSRFAPYAQREVASA